MSACQVEPTSPESASIEIDREIKSCSHYCYPSNLFKCCSCEDIRPISADGTYESYVDGVGYTNSAARDDGYCPVCNTKNYERWMKRVRAETEKKRLEDEERWRIVAAEKIAVERDRAANADRLGGRIEYSSGNVYVGDLLDGEPHGAGRMDYADNNDNILHYEGEWVRGKHEGRGKKVWMDDLWYEGDWENGRMHGNGVCHMNEVDILEGKFEEDEYCG